MTPTIVSCPIQGALLWRSALLRSCVSSTAVTGSSPVLLRRWDETQLLSSRTSARQRKGFRSERSHRATHHTRSSLDWVSALHLLSTLRASSLPYSSAVTSRTSSSDEAARARCYVSCNSVLQAHAASTGQWSAALSAAAVTSHLRDQMLPPRRSPFFGILANAMRSVSSQWEDVLQLLSAPPLRRSHTVDDAVDTHHTLRILRHLKNGLGVKSRLALGCGMQLYAQQQAITKRLNNVSYARSLADVADADESANADLLVRDTLSREHKEAEGRCRERCYAIQQRISTMASASPSSLEVWMSLMTTMIHHAEVACRTNPKASMQDLCNTCLFPSPNNAIPSQHEILQRYYTVSKQMVRLVRSCNSASLPPANLLDALRTHCLNHKVSMASLLDALGSFSQRVDDKTRFALHELMLENASWLMNSELNGTVVSTWMDLCPTHDHALACHSRRQLLTYFEQLGEKADKGSVLLVGETRKFMFSALLADVNENYSIFVDYPEIALKLLQVIWRLNIQVAPLFLSGNVEARLNSHCLVPWFMVLSLAYEELHDESHLLTLWLEAMCDALEVVLKLCPRLFWQLDSQKAIQWCAVGDAAAAAARSGQTEVCERLSHVLHACSQETIPVSMRVSILNNMPLFWITRHSCSSSVGMLSASRFTFLSWCTALNLYRQSHTHHQGSPLTVCLPDLGATVSDALMTSLFLAHDVPLERRIHMANELITKREAMTSTGETLLKLMTQTQTNHTTGDVEVSRITGASWQSRESSLSRACKELQAILDDVTANSQWDDVWNALRGPSRCSAAERSDHTKITIQDSNDALKTAYTFAYLANKRHR